jgi:prepilin-type processing-associated H-X9-DG protein
VGAEGGNMVFLDGSAKWVPIAAMTPHYTAPGSTRYIGYWADQP